MITFTLPEFSNPFAFTWWLFTHGGYFAVIIAFGYGIFWMYMEYIQNRYLSRIKYVLLAIDVPKENEQTPKAVEHMFSHIHGIQKGPDSKEKYFDGYVQPSISIELVSLGGYIQYLIRCPVANRDLVESAIYAQYPNAEISEVEDYVNAYDAKFPNDEYNMWGAEMVLVNSDVYPIKTYPLWEHSLTQTFLDPMASLLENLARIDPREQIWLQWVLRPTADNSWREKGIKTINKLIGLKGKKKTSFLDSLADAPGAILAGTYDTLTRTIQDPAASSASTKKDNDPPSLMQHLAPNVRVVVEAIGMKISKLGFETKFRMLYFGPKDIFTKARVAGMFGALKQYASLDMNGFKPDKKMKTSRVWFFVKRRVANIQRQLLLGYKNRSIWRGRKIYVLNIEELASLWHFPVITVKAPLVKKTEAKRGEPPTALPVGEEMNYQPKRKEPEAVAETQSSPVPTGAAPTNLPI